MWAMAVLPTVSRALAANRPAQVGVAVCAVAGPRALAVEATGIPQPAGPSGGIHRDHCPFCTLGVDQALLPVPDAGRTWSDATAASPLASLATAAPPRHAWLRAQPRAPPLGA
jgi:hypothetical protein